MVKMRAIGGFTPGVFVNDIDVLREGDGRVGDLSSCLEELEAVIANGRSLVSVQDG